MHFDNWKLNFQHYSLLSHNFLPENLKKLSIKNLPILAQEIRDLMIKVAAERGGHLGASLGVVELSIALHYVFTAPKDIIIWDIGHQTYPHKILTGRAGILNTVRQKNGISGFLRMQDSEFDSFGAGHSSTSISAAIGMLAAKKLNHNTNQNAQINDIIAVIGDSAIGSGIAYEALNNITAFQDRIIIILNDNQMSIAPAVGSLSKHLAQLLASKTYSQAKTAAKHALKYMPSFVQKITHHASTGIKRLIHHESNKNNIGNIFENLGLKYIGPIDGHNVKDLIQILSAIKNDPSLKIPILIHVKTEKGKGFSLKDKSDECYHAVTPFDIKTKTQHKTNRINLSYTEIFAKYLNHLLEKDKAVCAITAGMPSGTGLSGCDVKFRERIFDVGISEQHAVTFAAGLAACKMKPFVAIYSTFLQRAYDQIVHDVAIQSLPVKFAIDRAGFVGPDGPTHTGAFDIAFLCNIPNFIVIAPSNAKDLARAMLTAYSVDDAPVAFRFPKELSDIESIDTLIRDDLAPLKIGRSKILIKGDQVAIIALGARSVKEALEAANIIKAECDILVTVVDARFAKPLDADLLINIIKTHKALITIEEGASGGFGACVASLLLNECAQNDIMNTKIRIMHFPDYFIEHQSAESMQQEAHLTAQDIANNAKIFIKKD